VEYEALTRQPASTLTQIYDFIGAPQFTHDFENVDYDAEDFDMAIGAPGLHTVARKVAFTPRDTVLPPELFRRFEGDAFWTDPHANPRVRVIRRPT